jgi:hypothetical protein
VRIQPVNSENGGTIFDLSKKVNTFAAAFAAACKPLQQRAVDYEILRPLDRLDIRHLHVYAARCSTSASNMKLTRPGSVENLATLKLCHSLKPSDELSSERLHGTENPPEQILPENFDYAAEDTTLAASSR